MMSVYKNTNLIPKDQESEIEFSNEIEKYGTIFSGHMNKLQEKISGLTDSFAQTREKCLQKVKEYQDEVTALNASYIVTKEK